MLKQGLPIQLKTFKLNVGDTGRVVGFDNSFPPYRQKMLAMGLTPGTEFTVIRIAPLGDPIEIRVREMTLVYAKMKSRQ